MKNDVHDGPYPHGYGCQACRDAGVCDVCGGPADRPGIRCTNGRCLACHGEHCTPGGGANPGHGYGNVGTLARKEMPEDGDELPEIRRRCVRCERYLGVQNPGQTCDSCKLVLKEKL